MALVDAREAVDAHLSASWTELSTAWETGNYASVAQWWGRQTGALPDVALQALSEAYGVCKLLARSTPWARRVAAAKEAQLIAELEALGPAPRAADIPTGAPLVYETHGRNTYGIDRVMNNKVQPFVDEFGIPIGVRRRGPGSIAKIEAGTHGPKPFHLKAKNTSQPDVGFLGFIDDLDTVAIKDPPLRGEVIAALDAIDASPDLRAQVIAQHTVRMEEWYGKGVDMFTGTGGTSPRATGRSGSSSSARASRCPERVRRSTTRPTSPRAAHCRRTARSTNGSPSTSTLLSHPTAARSGSPRSTGATVSSPRPATWT
ncbi:MAG: hypothetical protein M5T61_18625 [Acidimicrobiia bacterium]|nr:hypothetical protein [Acidimicrobiia bacterium]